jgi:iron complex outermembrane recepter protein
MALGCAATAVTQISHAAGAEADNSALQEIVVTGTSIRGLNAETALPVQVIKAEDIARTGATSTEDLLRTISAAASSGSTNSSQGTGFLTGGISTVSLRGLGSARTLVLINGRRSAAYGGGSAGTAGNSVDINSIPVAAIERIEVLKDGASAIYGSDAVAGVVNFILRSDFTGLDVMADAGTPTRQGGAQEELFSAYGGFGSLSTDRFNVSGGVNFAHQGDLMGYDRSFASRYSPEHGNDVTSSFAFPANIAVPANPAIPLGQPGHSASTQNPLAGNCGAASINDVNFPTQCRFDNSPSDSLQPEQQRLSGNLNAHFALNDTNQLYAEGTFADVKTLQTVQPVPLSNGNPMIAGNPYIAYLANLLATKYPTYNNPAAGPGTGAFLLGPDSPYYPTAWVNSHPEFGLVGQPLNLIYRDFANGLRNTQDDAKTLRLVGGVKGVVLGWDYDASFLYSEVRIHEELLSGYPLYSKMMPLLDSGVINPFGPTTDPAALAAAKGAEFVGQDFASKTSITGLQSSASRKLLDLPYGALSTAVGAEVRRETFVYDPSLAIQGGDIAGQGGNQLPEDASRNVESVYLEVNAPVVPDLTADAAVRWDNYQGIGHTVNPKGSLRYQPVSWAVLRASAGTGFRAPSLTDLYASQATSVTSNGTRDPIKCPTFDANNPACSFQFTTVTGGNPNLKPEKSTTYTFGVGLEPVKGLTVDLDSFWIYLKNSITVGGLSYAVILQNAQTATQFASLINRNANGDIVSISQTNANLFKDNVSGLDTDLKYNLDFDDFGRLQLRGTGTYYYKFASQNPNGSWTGQLDRGLTNAGGIIPRWKDVLTAAYTLKDFSGSVTNNYQKSYNDVPGNISGVGRRVGHYSTWDGQLAYSGVKNLTFTVGMLNIGNVDPPYANYAASANNFVGGYDLAYADARGRFVYLRANYSLH